MIIKVYEFYTRDEMLMPIAIYGNVPFYLDTENATLNVYLSSEHIVHKYWTYSTEIRGELKIYKKAFKE